MSEYKIPKQLDHGTAPECIWVTVYEFEILIANI